MKPLRSHTEQKTPKIQPFLRFHYLLKFIILMSCPGPAGDIGGPQNPSPNQGAPTNVNSWIRAWGNLTSLNN